MVWRSVTKITRTRGSQAIRNGLAALLGRVLDIRLD
jgi:hypothetical protein